MKKPVINKNVMALLLAIGFGVVGAFGLKKVFDFQLSRAKSDGQTVQYVVASKDIEAGTAISMDIVAVRSVPAKWAHSNGVTADSYGQIEGAITLVALKRGDTILWATVDTDKNRQITSKIPLGRRAITIPVDDESSISSMLKPGDLIDLFVTANRAESTETHMLMSGVRILATGSNLSSNEAVRNAYDPDGAYRTITLNVAVDEAKNIILASSMGKLNAVLRNPGDQTQVAVGQELAGAPVPVRRLKFSPAPTQVRELSVIYGNRE